MLRLLLLSLLLLGLGGCSDLQTRLAEPPSKPMESSTEALDAADVMAKEGRWSQALALLEKAARDYPGDPAIEARRVSMRERWERQERVLEDQIMVGDAENQELKIALLEKLSLAEPGNLIVTSRRIYWKEVLASNIEKLTACGEFHVTTDTALARRCFQLASGMAATPDIEQRLAGISEQLLLSENVAAERRRAKEEKERQRGRSRCSTMRRRRSTRVITDVHWIFWKKSRNCSRTTARCRGLQEEAWSMISPQVEALVKLGDHLYLDEQLDAAVATWQAALTLKPDDEAILARIDRAKTVLNRLDALRRQQNPSTENE